MKRKARSILLVLLFAAACRSSNMIEIERRQSESEEVFQEFWEFFENNYAFFELRGVSWKGMYSRYLHFVRPEMTEEQLWQIMASMLDPLDDAQVILEQRGRNPKVFRSAPPSRFEKEFPSDSLKEKLATTTRHTLLANGFSAPKKPESITFSIRTPEILNFSTSADYGYLKVVRFASASKRRTKKQIDEIMEAFSGKKGVIIDLRQTNGHEEKAMQLLADQFAGKQRLGYFKQKRKGENYEDFTNLKSWNLKPKGKVHFTLPTILLINEETVGSAEVLVMVLSELQHVEVIGMPSKGAFSAPLVNHLPNGWYVTLSHERVFAADTTCYEGKGVPVDYQIGNHRHELASERDPVLAHALEVLAARTKKK